MDCGVCIEPCNKSSRKDASCVYCNFSVCQQCLRRYLLAINSPKCMECGRAYSRRTLCKLLPKSFINGAYAAHMAEVYYDIERAKMPSIQSTVDRLLRQRHLHDVIREYEAKSREYQKTITGYIMQIGMSDELTLDELVVIYEKKVLASNVAKAGIEKIGQLQNELRLLDSTQTQFTTRKCLAENCRGFLNTDWKCGVCGRITCKSCLNLDSQQHVCNESDVATARLLVENTKNCPTCGIGIYRVSGCSQMWCTECHTAFDWDTGDIAGGPIHNPEFFEWRRRNAIPLGDGLGDFEPLCGREIDANVAFHFRSTMDGDFAYDNIYRLIILRHDQLRQFEPRDVTRKLCIEYMLNNISESDFKSKLVQYHKRAEKNREIYQLIILFLDCYADIIFRFIEFVRSFRYFTDEELFAHQVAAFATFADDFYVEIGTLRDYVNQCFVDIANVYECKSYRIDNNNNLL